MKSFLSISIHQLSRKPQHPSYHYRHLSAHSHPSMRFLLLLPKQRPGPIIDRKPTTASASGNSLQTASTPRTWSSPASTGSAGRSWRKAMKSSFRWSRVDRADGGLGSGSQPLVPWLALLRLTALHGLLLWYYVASTLTLSSFSEFHGLFEGK